MTDLTKYDAHKSAVPTEHTFTLQGEDPYTPTIINLWGTLMLGEMGGLEPAYDEVRNELRKQITQGNSFGGVQMDKGKHTKAYRLAMSIRDGDSPTRGEGEYDAHKSAKSDEMTFTLQSSDPYCADLIELWAALVTGNLNETDMRFQQITKTFMTQAALHNPFGKKQRKKGKILDAYQRAHKFNQARINNANTA